MKLKQFSGMEWYEYYGKLTAEDGEDGRLVSMHSFSESWGSWEMHPVGEELVICVSGEVELVQEIDGTEQSLLLAAGDAIINPKGVWHTANVPEGKSATVVFITPGFGTENRPR